jgi:hypothetical protein
MKKMNLNAFMQSFGPAINEAMTDMMAPVYSGVDDQCMMRDLVLDGLDRAPFEKQRECIHAATNLLLDHDAPAAIINADMGTGKTQMAACVAQLLHYEKYAKRILVLSPPHLVYKWRREILNIISDARVTVLNGPDSIVKLLALREMLNTPDHDGPEFFIIGRVRMRMGFNWKPSFVSRTDMNTGTKVASCPDCGATVKTLIKGEMLTLTPDSFPDHRLACLDCGSALWSLNHKHKPKDLKEQLKSQLERLPTIGPKTSANLLTAFGEEFISQTMSDNFYELVNLQKDGGDFYFSDRQAERLEKAFSRIEFGLGQANYQPTEFIKRYLPNNYFGLMIVDEGHEYKNYGTAQGQAMGVLCNKVKKVLLLTGTLMGGYADDVFYLLWRIMPKIMIGQNFTHRHGGLQRAGMDWMKQYGCLEMVYKTTEGSHKTSKGKKTSVNVRKRPGFSPVAIVKHILPYTVFMRLSEIGENVLPQFSEHYHEIEMDDDLRIEYNQFSSKLMAEMKTALAKGDKSLLGTVFSALISYPDTSFQGYTVKHPKIRNVLAEAKALRAIDESDNKLDELVGICCDARDRGRRVLVYTTFTGKRDSTKYLKTILDAAGFKTFVMKSTVATDQREDWIMDKVDRGCEVLICNPELVKTGLDLLEFPTITFMQTGYNVYTLMQARMRSYRIGQTEDVEIHYLGYAGCAQASCLQLMQKKVTVTQSTSGEIPACGLDAINVEDESLEVAMARDLMASMDGLSIALNKVAETEDVIIDEKLTQQGDSIGGDRTSVSEVLGEVANEYSRSDALDDGFLVDLSELAKEKGIKHPVAMTRDSYTNCVEWNQEDCERKGVRQDVIGRACDVLTMLKDTIEVMKRSGDTVSFKVMRVPREGQGLEPEIVRLSAKVGPGDNQEPVITVM